MEYYTQYNTEKHSQKHFVLNLLSLNSFVFRTHSSRSFLLSLKAMTTATILIENDCRIWPPEINATIHDPTTFFTFGVATTIIDYAIVNITNNDTITCNRSSFVMDIKVVESNVPGNEK